jgi:hypothetical protein
MALADRNPEVPPEHVFLLPGSGFVLGGRIRSRDWKGDGGGDAVKYLLFSAKCSTGSAVKLIDFT